MQKTKFLSVRVDPKLYEKINVMASQAGVTVSDLVRDRVLKNPDDDCREKEKVKMGCFDDDRSTFWGS